MKLTVVLLTVALLQVSARSSSQTVSYSGKAVSLPVIFSVVEKQTGFIFFYDAAILRESKPVTISARDLPFEDFIRLALRDQPLKYLIENKAVIISRKNLTSPEADQPPGADVAGDAPTMDVHGHVTDSAGNPLVGVTILVKGKRIVTVTDENGNFSLAGLSQNATLIVSSVGYETQERRLNGNPSPSFQLKISIISMQDAVINKGYYSVKQKYNTGDVTTVKGEELTRQPVTDPILALSGKVPGLAISQLSGVPGSSLQVQLRGQNSIANSNDPLYIVDGVPFNSSTLTSLSFGFPATLSPFSYINSNDIESIDVLKDADATAIYGSRGSNGVILITTKKGRQGKAKADLSFYQGEGAVTRMLPLLDAQQYLALRKEAFANDGVSPGPGAYDLNGTWDQSRSTDWQKLLIGGTSHITDAQASLSGGNEYTQFILGAGYHRETAVFPGSTKFSKASAHINLNHLSVDRRFHANFSATYFAGNSDMPMADFTNFITLAPDAPPIYNADGSLNWANSTWSNPLAETRRRATDVTGDLISGLNLSYRLLPGLTLSSNFAYSTLQNDQNQVAPQSYYDPAYSAYNLRHNAFANASIKSWSIEPQLNYERKFGAGNLNILIGSTFQQTSQAGTTILGFGFPSDALLYNVTAASSTYLTQTASLFRYNAFYGRANYILSDKYILNLTARRDGSSRFGPGNQFGNFGAIGAGWIFTQEKFIQNSLPFLSFGKLRTSYGTTGNGNIGDYQYLSTYSSQPYTYLGATVLVPNNIGNPDYHWEVIKKFEVALELGLCKDRINLTVSYYRNRTGNQLVGYGLPTITGFSSVQANLPAIIQNTGAEFQVNIINIRNTSFKWTSSFNLSIPRNKLIAYPNIAGSSYANLYTIGKSLSTYKRYHYTGVNPQTGVYSFQDINHDGQITYPDDLVGEKQVARDYYGALQNSITYKGFQLDLQINFIRQTGSKYVGFLAFNQNTSRDALQRWQRPGDQTNTEILTQDYSSPAVLAYDMAANNSDIYISDVSFIRLSNLTLSYQIPLKWQQQLHLHGARIYAQCQNLLTITHYDGLDPETQGRALPPIRMITAGIQLTF